MARPRTASPEDDELIVIGENLVKWAKGEDLQPGEKRWRYCEWYLEQGLVRSQWEKMIEKPAFRWYYEQAQGLLAKNYIDGSVNPSIAHRFIRIYCPDVKDEENAKTKYDAEISSQHNVVPVSDAIAAQQTAILEQLAGLQVSRTAARSNSKTDSKS